MTVPYLSPYPVTRVRDTTCAPTKQSEAERFYLKQSEARVFTGKQSEARVFTGKQSEAERCPST